jgi:hypothetical protein
VLSRRVFVSKLAIGAAVASTAGIARAEQRQGRSAAPGESDAGQPDAAAAASGAQTAQAVMDPVPAPPWNLLHPLTAGAVIRAGWVVRDLGPIANGSCVLTLEDGDGRSHRVHLCRNAGDPQGLVHTEHIDLVVMNGGQGDVATREELAQAVADVAHVVANNERAEGDVIAELLSHRERVERFASATALL